MNEQTKTKRIRLVFNGTKWVPQAGEQKAEGGGQGAECGVEASDSEHRTSNVEHPTSNEAGTVSEVEGKPDEHPTSNVEHSTSNGDGQAAIAYNQNGGVEARDCEHRTSSVEHSTSNEEGSFGQTEGKSGEHSTSNAQHSTSNGKRKRRETEWVLEEVFPWPEPVDPRALLDELRAVLIRFVLLPLWAAETLALWIVHTYLYQFGEVSTYIGVESPVRRCGKSTLMIALKKLACRAVVSSNITPPALFRAIAEKEPTLLIDEADTFLHGNEQMRGILNSGYTREMAYVVRVGYEKQKGKGASKEDSSSLRSFSCWGPKVIAKIGRLPDTLADRCIPIRMERKMRKEELDRIKYLDGTVLRRKCKRLALDYGQAVADARPQLPESLNDRACDIWEPLFALADLAGGHWPGLARQAAEHLSATAEEVNPSGSLLKDISLTFTDLKTDRIFTRSLIEHLNRKVDRPWQEMRHGKEINETWLAKQLSPYGVRPKTIWIGQAQAKGYLAEDFTTVFSRYLTSSDLSAEPRPEGKVPE